MHRLKELIESLVRHEVEFVVVGGYAALAHGSSVMTQDLDICFRFDEANLQKLVRALEGLHPVHRLTPQKLPFRLTTDLCAGLKNLYLQTDAGVLDCLSEVAGIGPYDAVLVRSVQVDTPLGKCRILDVDALIVAKETMGRMHDLLTVRQLKAIRERQEKR